MRVRECIPDARVHPLSPSPPPHPAPAVAQSVALSLLQLDGILGLPTGWAGLGYLGAGLAGLLLSGAVHFTSVESEPPRVPRRASALFVARAQRAEISAEGEPLRQRFGQTRGKRRFRGPRRNDAVSREDEAKRGGSEGWGRWSPRWAVSISK